MKQVQISDILAFLTRSDIPFTFDGDPSVIVDGFSSLNRYKGGSFTWCKTQKNIPDAFDLKQVLLAFISEDVNGEFQNTIRSPQSKRAFFSVMEHFYAEEEDRPPVGQFTYVSPKVKLGNNVRIGHNCTLDGEIVIGDNTVIWNNVTIVNRVIIGENCEIQSGTVIGHDGFAYSEDENRKKIMVKHFGGVVIGDNVSIFSGCNIARGTIDDTVIESGVKIDSHTHIGHNDHIEENVGMAMPNVLCGSVHIGKNSYLSGATVMNQLTVGENAYVGIRSVVLNNVDPEQKVFGYPARRFMPKEQK